MSDQAAARPAPPAQSLLWGLISTALLAGWIGWQFGWVCAIAGVVGVFVHEYGHVLAINALGYGPGRIQIIPFFGGAATPARPFASEMHGVLIALAGPLFGLLAMAPFFLAYAATGQEPWLGGALFVAGINLLNLAPAPPLDGSKALGPALARVHPWLERAAMLAIGALALFWAIQHRQLMLGVFMAIGTLGALRQGPLRPFASPLTPGQGLAAFGAYVVAVVLCALAVDVAANGAVLRWIGRQG
jgi:Zn-dependent protease